MSKILSGAENRPRIVNEAVRKLQETVADVYSKDEVDTFLAAKANNGANTDITSVYLNNTGLKVKDTNASHGLIFKPGSDLTADHTLTVTTGDADRTLTIGADSSISGTAYVAGGTDVPVADGGSGRSDATAYAVLCGGTTSTAAHQSVASVGTAGHVLKSNGAGALPSFQAQTNPIVTIASGTLASAATLDLAGFASYDEIQIQLWNWRPATNATELSCRFSQSGSFLSGASDYGWGRTVAGTTLQDYADDHIEMALNQGNNSDSYLSYTITLLRPSAASFAKMINYYGNYDRDTNFFPLTGAGRLIANTDAIDGIRFFYSSGNISTGYYVQRGITY